MQITVNDIQLDVSEQGWPFWFHICQDGNRIRFTHEEAPAIADALKNLVASQQRKERK